MTETGRRGAWPRRLTWILLGAILLWSLSLRLFYGVRPVGGPSYDERYNLRNVVRIVRTGDWTPENGYYAFLSYAPQAALATVLQRTIELPNGERFAVDKTGRPTARLVFLFRAVQAAYGTLLVFLVFLLTRRLGGDAAGLLGAGWASSSWLYVWAGAWFKPDAAAALCVTAAIYWAVKANEQPSLRRYLVAGIGIGLATSAKFTGVMCALALALFALFGKPGGRRRPAWLALSAVTSVLTFAITSPFWRTNLAASRRVAKLYAGSAFDAGNTFEGVLSHIFGEIFASLHGAFVSALFWVGLLAVFVPAAAGRFPRERRLSLRVVAAMPVLYVAGVLLVLTRAPFLRPNNVFPIVPLLAASAAVTAVELGRRLVEWRPGLGRPLFAALAALVMLAPPVATGTLDLYRRAVPTTQEIAFGAMREELDLRPRKQAPRIVFLEDVPYGQPPWDGPAFTGSVLLAMVRVDRLAAIDSARLDLADAEIFAEERLHGSERAFYESRLRHASEHGTVRNIRPRWLRSRGPELVLLAHPWAVESLRTLLPRPAVASAEETSPPMALTNEAIVSLVVLPSASAARPATWSLAGRQLVLHQASKPNPRAHLRLSERTRAPFAASTRPPDATGEPVAAVDLWSWREEAVAAPAPDLRPDSAEREIALDDPSGDSPSPELP